MHIGISGPHPGSVTELAQDLYRVLSLEDFIFLPNLFAKYPRTRDGIGPLIYLSAMKLQIQEEWRAGMRYISDGTVLDICMEQYCCPTSLSILEVSDQMGKLYQEHLATYDMLFLLPVSHNALPEHTLRMCYLNQLVNKYDSPAVRRIEGDRFLRVARCVDMIRESGKLLSRSVH